MPEPSGSAARVRAFAVGAIAAWRAPRVIAQDISTLLRNAHGSLPVNDDVEDLALRSARRVLSALTRIPGGPWRTTCLYRSVAECLALRALGRSARVAIAAGRADHDGTRDIRAHAWVEDGRGMAIGSARPDGRMQVFTSSGSQR